MLLNAWINSGDDGWSSSHSSRGCNSAIFQPTWLNSCLFYALKLVLHLSKQVTCTCSDEVTKRSSHVSFTTSSHRWSFNHIDSNLNIFSIFVFIFRGFCVIRRSNDEWSKTNEERWCSFVLGNRFIQSGVANALSNCSWICFPSNFWYSHMNFGLIKPRSQKPQKLIASLNFPSDASAWWCLPPFLISLQSH